MAKYTICVSYHDDTSADGEFPITSEANPQWLINTILDSLCNKEFLQIASGDAIHLIRCRSIQAVAIVPTGA